MNRAKDRIYRSSHKNAGRKDQTSARIQEPKPNRKKTHPELLNSQRPEELISKPRLDQSRDACTQTGTCCSRTAMMQRRVHFWEEPAIAAESVMSVDDLQIRRKKMTSNPKGMWGEWEKGRQWTERLNLLMRHFVKHVTIFWYNFFLILGDTGVHARTPSFGDDRSYTTYEQGPISLANAYLKGEGINILLATAA